MKPKKLSKGDTIGLISPSSGQYLRSYVTRAVDTLESWGYKTVLGRYATEKNGFLAGTDEQRAYDFNDMFRRSDIDAIFCTNGGYGSARILDMLDYDAVKANPKIFLGFSDITALHLAIFKNTGLITFHGPGATSFPEEVLTEYTKAQLEKALCITEPIGNIEMADKKKYLHRIGEGSAEGVLVGGNISMITTTLGTPYEIETEGRILFMEDLHTEPWVMDHMMAHMKNAGKLQAAAGIVIGECYHCDPRAHEPAYHVDTSLEYIFDEYLAPLNIPVLYGLPLGHTENMATLPHGARVRVDADKKELSVLESGVI